MKKIILLAITLVCTSLLRAQDHTEFNFIFNHLALTVKDLDRSVAFYSKLLSLHEITNRAEEGRMRWLSLGGNKELHLIAGDKEKLVADTNVHFAVATQHFDAFIKRLNEMQIIYSDADGKPHAFKKRADGVNQVYFQDPSGYWIEANDANTTATSIEQTKNDVWQKEEHYWKYVRERNLQAYSMLWDEKFMGYPSNNIITGKDHITDWIDNLYKDKNRKFEVDLVRKVENVFDDIVIVLYDVNYTWTNEKKEVLEKTFTKITHTWKKTDKGWLIIGGMGANK